MKDVPAKSILIVCSHFWPSVGGLESRMGQFSQELVMAGYQVAVMTLALPGRTSNRYQDVAIYGIDSKDFMSSIRTAVASGNFDACVLIQDPLGKIIWSIEDLHVPQRTRLLIQPIINEDGYSRWKDDANFAGRLAKILRKADAALVMTKAGPDKRFMLSAGIEHTYLPNASARSESAGDFRARFDIEPGRFLVLHVANLYWVKNHIGLIDALPSIPSNGKLVMVGNPSGSADCTEAVIAKLATRPDILFIPGLPREWISAAMQAADVVVLASHGEGSPITILEAMSHGCPWVATPSCGAASDHVGGVIAELPDFLDTLKILAGDRELRERLGQLALAHWEQCYSWPVAIQGWIDLIERGKLSRSFELQPSLREEMTALVTRHFRTLREQYKPVVDLQIFGVTAYRSGPLRFGWVGASSSADIHSLLIPAMGDEFQVAVVDESQRAPEQMAAFFNAIDVVLITQNNRADHLRAARAICCGSFVLAVDSPGVREVLQGTQAGLVVAADAVALRNAMRWCARSVDEVRKRGYRAAQQAVIRQFSSANVGADLNLPDSAA